MSNPSTLLTGNPGSVSATAVSQVIELSGEFAWDIFHTGYDAAGDAANVPVWLAINEDVAAAAVADKTVLLPPGQAYTFPKGTRSVAYLSGGAGEPVLTLLSSREGVK